MSERKRLEAHLQKVERPSYVGMILSDVRRVLGI